MDPWRESRRRLWEESLPARWLWAAVAATTTRHSAMSRWPPPPEVMAEKVGHALWRGSRRHCREERRGCCYGGGMQE